MRRLFLYALSVSVVCGLWVGHASGASAAPDTRAVAAESARHLAGHGPSPLFGGIFNRIRRALDFEAYEWEQVNRDAPWEARTGLQVVDLKGVFYLMGGRTPIDSPVPGDGIIHGDVWRSTDDGESWQELIADTEAQGDWPARAFFSAVKKGRHMYVLGGQNFRLEPNQCPPPDIAPGCPPFVSVSDFFSDVWKSKDGINWKQLTSDAGWEGRAGLSTVVHKGAIYVFGGSKNDDDAVIGGPPIREYFNDVWRSYDGVNWVQLTANAPWAKRAGAAAVVKNGYIYLLGGEAGFACEPLPFCTPPYFNDVWKSKDGKRWKRVTPAAGWSARPGHKCGVQALHIVCFGGFGLLVNPSDVWVSLNGKRWRQVSSSPWNIVSPDDARYDFALVSRKTSLTRPGGIFTFGGDRERFELSPAENAERVDNDVWRYAPAAP
ncbi:MAG: hypothetical protein ACR2OD_09025 [Gaiellaceae bacterium]